MKLRGGWAVLVGLLIAGCASDIGDPDHGTSTPGAELTSPPSRIEIITFEFYVGTAVGTDRPGGSAATGQTEVPRPFAIPEGDVAKATAMVYWNTTNPLARVLDAYLDEVARTDGRSRELAAATGPSPLLVEFPMPLTHRDFLFSVRPDHGGVTIEEIASVVIAVEYR